MIEHHTICSIPYAAYHMLHTVCGIPYAVYRKSPEFLKRTGFGVGDTRLPHTHLSDSFVLISRIKNHNNELSRSQPVWHLNSNLRFSPKTRPDGMGLREFFALSCFKWYFWPQKSTIMSLATNRVDSSIWNLDNPESSETVVVELNFNFDLLESI